LPAGGPEVTVPRRRSASLALPVAWAAWLLLFVTLGLQGFNLREDGYLLTLGARMAAGEVPYRDFSYVRPPLPVAIQAALLHAVPGYAVAGSRWYFAGQVAVILAVVCALLGRLGLSPWTRAALAFLATVTAFTGGFPAMPWHTVDGVFFATLATLALVVAAERRALPPLFLAGLLTGAAVLCKQGFLVVAAVGLALCLGPHGRRIGGRAGAGAVAYAAGGAFAGAAALIALAAEGALWQSAEAILIAPRELTRDDLRRSVLDLLVGVHLPSVRGAALGLGLVVLAARPVPDRVRTGLAAAGLLWVSVVAWLAPSIPTVYRTLLIEPVYTCAWLGGLGLLAGQATGRLRLAPGVTWMVALGLGTLYAAGWSYEAIRSAVLALALPLPLALVGWATADAGATAPRGPRFAAGCVLVYAGVLSLALHVAVPYLDGPRGALTERFATDALRGIRSSARRVRGVDGVVTLIRRETAPGDYVLAFMDFPSLYFLTGRRNPTRVDWFLSQELTIAERERVLADLKARPPGLVVLTALEPLGIINPRLRPILGHLLSHYRQAETVGEFLVFRPRR
jgi:hypothetical protein